MIVKGLWSAISKVFPGVFLLSGLLACVDGRAQQPATGFAREILSSTQRWLNASTTQDHGNIQPAAFGLDSTFYTHTDSGLVKILRYRGFSIKGFGNASAGYQFTDREQAISNGWAGVQLGWQWKNRWNIQAGYSINALHPPNYLSQWLSAGLNPGVGYSSTQSNGYSLAHYSYGNFSYNPGKFFHFELGKGKHFWGDGYRSLFISDNAAPYPYARITTQFWRLKYTNLWSQMRNVPLGKKAHQGRVKYTASHALSWNINKRWNVALYEMVVWQDRDSMNHRTLDINYLNPIIFYRPLEYSVGSPDNVIVGMSFRYKINDQWQLYGQFALDEFNLELIKQKKKWWANKYGGQLGIKVWDIGWQGLSIQTELNVVRPFTYTHGSPVQSWTHWNQPIAHPMGANFGEWVSFICYQHRAWRLSNEFIWATYGRDTDINGDGVIDNMGGNILRSYKSPFRTFDNVLYQGLRSVFHYNSLTIARQFSPQRNWEVFLTHSLRYEKNEKSKSVDHWLVLGVQTTGLLSPNRDF